MILKGSSGTEDIHVAAKADLKSIIARYKGLVEQSASSLSRFETGLSEVRGRLGALQTLESTSLRACERASLILIVQTEIVMPLMGEVAGQEVVQRRDEAISEIRANNAFIASFIEEVSRIDEFSQAFVCGSKALKGQIESMALKLERLQAREAFTIPPEALGVFEEGYASMETVVTETSALSADLCTRMTSLCGKISSIKDAITVSLTALTSVFASKPAGGVDPN
jgi:hypothetical protein